MNLPPHLNSESPQQSMGQMTQMMQGDESMMQDQESEPILAHFDLEELNELDEAQGEMVIDPETGLRDYRPLSKMLENPEIRNLVEQALSQTQENPGFAKGGMVEEPGRPTDPELEELRLQGRNGDTELAIITPELLELFTQWIGKEPPVNPETGLPEFFLGNVFKSALRVLGTALGPITGFIASKLTGQSTGAAFKNAFIGAALPAAAIGVPYMMGGMGGAGGGGMLSSLFGGGAGSAAGTGGGIMASLSGVGKMLPGMGQMAGLMQGQGGAPGGVAQAAGQQGGGGILSNLMGGLGNALPLAASAFMLNKGRKEERKDLRDYERDRRQETESERDRMGFNEPLKKRAAFDFEPTNEPLTQDQLRHGRIPRSFKYSLNKQYAAEGGAIRGIGKGQEDNIRKDIKKNSYIIDASTVSDIGDGSSNAGIKGLDQFFSKIPSQSMNSETAPHKSKGGYIEAMVSNDEYEVPAGIVTALGHGSNEKGAKILDKFVKEIRSKKRTSGEKLPPKAKPVGGYLNRLNAA